MPAPESSWHHLGQHLGERGKRWLAQVLRRRFEREMADYHHPPELRLGNWFRRGPPAQQQVFRSLVQVNFYPKPRPPH